MRRVRAGCDHHHRRISRRTHTAITRASATLMSAASRELRARKRHRRPQIASRGSEFQGASPSFEEREAERRKAHLGNSRGVFPGSPGNRGTRQRLAALHPRRLKTPVRSSGDVASRRFRAAACPRPATPVAEPRSGPGRKPEASRVRGATLAPRPQAPHPIPRYEASQVTPLLWDRMPRVINCTLEYCQARKY
jgi:hypothetical protein